MAGAPKPGWPYSDPRWKVVRRQVLERDGGICQQPTSTLTARGRVHGICGLPADAVDHVTPWRVGGLPFDPENLRAICTAHNTSKANRGRRRGGDGGDRPAVSRRAASPAAAAELGSTELRW